MRKAKWKRKTEILSVMWAMMPKTALTMHRIAFWIGLKPSGHLLKILHEMEEDGMLSRETVPHRPNINKFLWSLTPQGIRRAEAVHRARIRAWG